MALDEPLEIVSLTRDIDAEKPHTVWRGLLRDGRHIYIRWYVRLGEGTLRVGVGDTPESAKLAAVHRFGEDHGLALLGDRISDDLRLPFRAMPGEPQMHLTSDVLDRLLWERGLTSRGEVLTVVTDTKADKLRRQIEG